MNPYLALFDNFTAPECGTPSGNNYHRKLGTPPCAACLQAAAEASAEWRQLHDDTQRRLDRQTSQLMVRALAEHRAKRAALQAATETESEQP